jgi:hypothetical protein
MTAAPPKKRTAKPSATIKGPEEELHPSLASDPAAGLTDEVPNRRPKASPFVGWTLVGLGAVLLFVLALVLLKPPGPGAPAVPDLIVQGDEPAPRSPPSDIEAAP